jgi:regulator of protease activity HflC (stomatin/prohibitin superfamily)
MIYLLIIALFGLAGLRILQQYQRGLHFRLGRYQSTRSPGLTGIIPRVDRLQAVDVRVITQGIEPQETMTNDNVPVKVPAVVWYKVNNPANAIIQVSTFQDAVARRR